MPITFPAVSITFCITFAIRYSNNKIATLTISPNSSGLLPFCSTDSLIFSVISVFLISTTSVSDIPLTIARSTALFHSMRISLSAFISSALGLFLPTFFVARYGPFLSNMLSLSLSSITIWLIRSVYNTFISSRKDSCLKRPSFTVKILRSYASPFLMILQPLRIFPSPPSISFFVRT